MNDLQFLTRILTKFLKRILLTKARRKDVQKSSDISVYNTINREEIKGSVERSRHERHFCSLPSYFYFLDFKFSNFVCPSELHPLIWFFFKNSFRKKNNIPKTAQNALAPSIFIVVSIVLKLGTPLLRTQAQNTLLQIF